MTEDKKRKTIKKSMASPRKRVVKKKATTRRRVSSKATSPKKVLGEDEFSIPIHTIDPAHFEHGDSEDDTQVQEPSKAEPSEDQYTLEHNVSDIKTSGIERRGEHVVSKEEGVALDLSDSSQKKKKKALKIVLIILGVLLGIGAIGAVVYALLLTRSSSFTGEAGIFTVSGPEDASSGHEVTYTVSFENNEQVGFEDIAFDVVYPEGFTRTSVNPKASNINQTKWEVGTLSPGKKTEIQISGVLIGAENEDKELVARLIYRPENVSTPFSEEKSVHTIMTALDTSFTITGPESVTSGEEFSFDVLVENTTGVDLDNMRIKLTYPDGFEFKSGKPRPDFSDDTFDIGSIADGENEKISVAGIISGKTNEKATITAELGFVNDSNEFISQISKKHAVVISEVIASLETLVSGQKTNALSLGETIQYSVTYKNEGTEAFKDVRIETRVDTNFIDVASVSVDRGRFEDSVVVWDKDSLSDLETVNPGDEGTLSFTVKIDDQVPASSSEEKNLSINAVSTFISNGVEGDQNKKVSIESNKATTKINSGLQVTVAPHYYDFEGTKVGSGPLPPVKNVETQYRVYITVSNTFNEIDNLVVSLQAPDNVVFTGKKGTEVGTVTTNNKTATWDVGKVPAHTGRFSKNIEAYVDITFTPTADQVDSVPNLLSSVSVSAKDVYTEQIIKPTVGVPTTSLSDDAFATEGGVVQAEETIVPDSTNSIISPDNVDQEPFVDPNTQTEAETLR